MVMGHDGVVEEGEEIELIEDNNVKKIPYS